MTLRSPPELKRRVRCPSDCPTQTLQEGLSISRIKGRLSSELEILGRDGSRRTFQAEGRTDAKRRSEKLSDSGMVGA